MNNRHVIFDFDGTLVDSFHMAIGIFNLLADQYHFRKVGSEEVEGLRDRTSSELIKYLQIPIYKIPRILLAARQQMRSEICKLLPIANLPDVLHELHQKKITLGILTSNSSENVTEWLIRNNIRHLFNYIHIESNFFGKQRVLKKMIKAHKLELATTFYVGDETRDIEAANACEVNSVAVTWGFNSVNILSQHQPTFIAHKPEDILRIASG